MRQLVSSTSLFLLYFCLQLRKETYSRLTPTQRLQVARHPNRPTCLDIILNISGDS
jgi:acetyl-CoA carboxylase alpha subunit